MNNFIVKSNNNISLNFLTAASVLNNKYTTSVSFATLPQDVPFQIPFDGPTSNSIASSTAAGLITINESGVYNLSINLFSGRNAGGGTTLIVGALVVNGTPLDAFSIMRIGPNDLVVAQQNLFTTAVLPAGTTLALTAWTDSSGGQNDNGALRAEPIFATGIIAPCYQFQITRDYRIDL